MSCLDLSSRRELQTSPAFYERLVREAIERIQTFRPGSVVDVRKLRQTGIFAGITVAVFSIAWLLFGDRVNTALARVFSPFDDIPPVTGVSYTVLTTDTKWPRGKDVPFSVLTAIVSEF